MKGLCCPLSLFVLLVASKCLEADARGGARFSAIENADSDGGKGKSGKGKSSGESGKTGKGKSSEESGKTGKGGKGKNGAGGGDCNCAGVEEFRYLTTDEIYTRAVGWLEINTAVDAPDIPDTLPLTQAQAVTLAPGNCYLATPMNLFEAKVLNDLAGGAEGWIGAFKEFDEAVEDGMSGPEAQRDGWMTLCGALVDSELWADGEPAVMTGMNVADVENGAVFVGGMLASMSPLTQTVPGAYYRCCFQVLPDSCYEGGNLRELIPPISPTPDPPTPDPPTGPQDPPPTASPSDAPSDAPSPASQEPSAAPSDAPSTASREPSAAPSDAPSTASREPSAAPSDTPSTASQEPSTSPTQSQEPSSTPSNAPSESQQPSLPPSNAPSESSAPSVGPSEPRCRPEPVFDVDDTLLQCSQDSDCGLPGSGAICERDGEDCICDCPKNKCFANEGGSNNVGDDGTCTFLCACVEACTDSGCDNTLCPACFGPDDCPDGQDCNPIMIPGQGMNPPMPSQISVCEPSGFCTGNKNLICDAAYSVVTGATDNRGKCCPPTSGCSVRGIGARDQTECATNCGADACLDASGNTGNLDGSFPDNYCVFGDSVQNAPYCPLFPFLTVGQLSCNGGANPDGVGDNSLCCNDEDEFGGPPPPGWNCDLDTNDWGVPDCPVCVDENSQSQYRLDNPNDAPIPLCNETACADPMVVPFTRADYSRRPSSAPTPEPVR